MKTVIPTIDGHPVPNLTIFVRITILNQLQFTQKIHLVNGNHQIILVNHQINHQITIYQMDLPK